MVSNTVHALWKTQLEKLLASVQWAWFEDGRDGKATIPLDFEKNEVHEIGDFDERIALGEFSNSC